MVVGHKAWSRAFETAKAECHTRAATTLAELAIARGECTSIIAERERLAAQLDAHSAHATERNAAVAALISGSREELLNATSENLRRGLTWAAGVAKSHVERLQDVFARDNAQRDVALEQMVRPVRDGLETLRALTTRVERDRANALGTLQEQLRQLAAGHDRLSEETSSLTRALRTPNVRGQWGEMQLQRLVESAGMLRHVDFVTQPTLTDDDGSSRPDMVITLPGSNSRKIVVDSKAPLDAYLKATDARTESERASWMDAHAAQVRRHVEQLSKKQYGDRHPDANPITFLFLPAESLYAEAVARDGALVQYALERHVMLVSPATLLLALRIVAYAWQQDTLSNTAVHVRELGAQLYARIGTVATHLEKLRRSLSATVSAFNGVSASIESRVLPTSRKLHRLFQREGDVLSALEPIDASAHVLSAGELVDATSEVEAPLDDVAPRATTERAA